MWGELEEEDGVSSSFLTGAQALELTNERGIGEPKAGGGRGRKKGERGNAQIERARSPSRRLALYVPVQGVCACSE